MLWQRGEGERNDLVPQSFVSHINFMIGKLFHQESHFHSSTNNETVIVFELQDNSTVEVRIVRRSMINLCALVSEL